VDHKRTDDALENPGYIALSRQMVLKRQMDVLANNLANVTTPGFKGESMLFVEHLKRTDHSERLRFVQDIATVRDLAPGPMTHTGSPFDLAIRGDGYFAVETPEGERYTRAGGLALDADGQIVTAQGLALLSDGGSPITVPPDAASVTVARDGTVSSDQGEIGRIRLVRFESPQVLNKLEHGLYDAAGQEPLPVEAPDIQQGKVEGSNVVGMVEMTKLITTVRSYQAAANLADQEHQRQRRAIEALASVRS
jgi:flagellar basal-body rod protein FlgF